MRWRSPVRLAAAQGSRKSTFNCTKYIFSCQHVFKLTTSLHSQLRLERQQDAYSYISIGCYGEILYYVCRQVAVKFTKDLKDTRKENYTASVCFKMFFCGSGYNILWRDLTPIFNDNVLGLLYYLMSTVLTLWWQVQHEWFDQSRPGGRKFHHFPGSNRPCFVFHLLPDVIKLAIKLPHCLKTGKLSIRHTVFVTVWKKRPKMINVFPDSVSINSVQSFHIYCVHSLGLHLWWFKCNTVFSKYVWSE